MSSHLSNQNLLSRIEYLKKSRHHLYIENKIFFNDTGYYLHYYKNEMYKYNTELEYLEAEKRKRQLRLEQALSIVDNSEMFANSFAAAQQLAALDAATRVSQYYSLTIPGGSYNDTQVLVDKKIDDNKQGLRNGLAQQLLHEQMIQSQYD